MIKKFTRSFILPVFAVGIVILFSLRAEGSIFVVTNPQDTTGIASLRGAIIHANQIGGNNIIILGELGKNRQHEFVFPLTLSGADESASQTGDLDVMQGNLTIMGMGSHVIIDATGLGDRVFQVFPNAHLTLSHLIIRGGTAPGNSDSPFSNGEAGGAIFNAGILHLKNCVITNNAGGGGNFPEGNGGGTDGGDGGAFYNSGILTMNNCLVTGNSAGAGADGASGGNGGGIKNDGVCTLTETVISGNHSGDGGGPDGNAFGFGGSGGSGGGIFNSGTMVLNKCDISENAGGQGSGGGDPGIASIFSPGGPGGNGGGGAGIYNAGQMRLNFSSVYDNASGSGGNGGSFGSGGNAGIGGNGAGICNTGKLSLNTSTISGNLCGNGGIGGNGFALDGAAGGDGGGGGGIYNGGSLDLTSCTIALNQTGMGGNAGNSAGRFSVAFIASGGQGGEGGGIFNAGDTAVAVRNTLIALNLINASGADGTNSGGLILPPLTIAPISPNAEIGEHKQIENTEADGTGFDIAGDFTSQKFNLIGMADGGTGFTDGVNADHVGSNANPLDPLIGPLQMNGGFTPTHALLPQSPAIDQGDCFKIHADQCGHKRPYNKLDPNAVGGDGSDIGAFELEATAKN
jgi:hypothetical protein